MAGAGILSKALAIVLPRTQKKGGLGLTGTYTPSNTSAVLAIPQYRDHLNDLFDTRQASDSRELMKLLAKQDPDVSAAFNAYLTIAATEPVFLAKTPDGQIDPNGMTLIQQTLLMLTKQNDYTLGFQYRPSLETICENFRYMLLMRGAICAELVYDKNLSPSEVRQIDPFFLFWWEKVTGQYKPELRQAGQILELDIPTIFTSFHHRDPTTIYTDSNFVSSINTIAARQQIINDLYRIMKITGYPRLDIEVMEEIIIKNAPADIRKDAAKMRQWSNDRLNDVRSTIENIRPDQAMVHWDSAKLKTVNDGKPGMALNITPVIDVLNGQNQAALKVMATIIGRGESGVNTASVEARVFALNCDQLNKPVAELLSNMFTLALRVQGFQGYVEVCFKKAEMRGDLELEPQLTMKASRLKEDLSLGLITDQEYHMQMYSRMPPDGVKPLMGTGFMQPQTSAGIPDAIQSAAGGGGSSAQQPGSVARAATPPGSKSAKSNTVKKAA
jgi:hypothetical protein